MNTNFNENPPNAPNANVAQNQKDEEWDLRNELKTKSGKPFSKWHADRLRILQEDNDYDSFIQFIKWAGGNPPNEDNYNEDYEYLFDLIDVFESLGGYEFFKKHNLDLPPCGISGVDEYY